jgi:hypothetical protein
MKNAKQLHIVYGKNRAHKKWIDTPARSKRLENESLHEIVHKGKSTNR